MLLYELQSTVSGEGHCERLLLGDQGKQIRGDALGGRVRQLGSASGYIKRGPCLKLRWLNLLRIDSQIRAHRLIHANHFGVPELNPFLCESRFRAL